MNPNEDSSASGDEPVATRHDGELDEQSLALGYESALPFLLAADVGQPWQASAGG